MAGQCKHPRCSRDQYRIGYCTTHRNRFRLGKDMSAPFRGSIPVQDLFWGKVQKSEGCWEWTATRSVEGYGNFWFNKSMVRAHRLSYEWAHGQIPDGMQVDHACRNTGCVNPAHLRLATNALNSQNRSGAYANSTSGVRGVSWHKRDSLWQAYATLNRKRIYIGRFSNKEEAEAAVTEWRRDHMPYSLMDQEKES